MFFASDNAGPVLPEVMQAMAEANAMYAPSYGADDQMTALRRRVRELFEAPEAAVHLVATGTAANALALATLSQPWQTIFCTPLAHVQTDECNAPEFYTGGAKLTLVGEADKMTPGALAAAIGGWPAGDVHNPQQGPVSLTQVTERGRVYSLEELHALSAVARDHGLPVYMDGARFANALAALDCTPAEMTWKAGVDALSLGGTKNGCMGVEAVIFFDPARSWEFELRRKRAAQLFSKHRYLSAQMLGYLAEDTWLRAARLANARAARLADGLRALPQAQLLFEPQANMIFATLPRAAHHRLREAGASYHLSDPLDGADADAPLAMRLVCDWSVTEAQIEDFLTLAAG